MTPARTSAPGAGHRVIQEWMGEAIETLEDLLRPRLRAVCVGINPAEVSVAAGHYYQGLVGRRFLSRLATVGALPQGLAGRMTEPTRTGSASPTSSSARLA